MAPPAVELSTTLRDLYMLDGGNADDIALVYTIPANTRRALSTACPAVHKYAYQSPLSEKAGPDTTARFILGCMSQFYGFIAGPMELRLFDIDKTKVEKAYESMSWSKTERSHRVDAARAYERVNKAQRADLRWIETPGDVAKVGKKLAVVSPMDFLDDEDVEMVVEQQVHWTMLSKTTLSESGLPTPNTELLATEFTPEHISSGGTYPFEERQAETERMLKCIEERPLPFVVKLPYGYGGHAVFVVSNDEKREKCTSVLRTELPDFLPTDLLIQEIMPDKSVAVSIFVTKAGRSIFISCSEEVHDEKGSWSGGMMDYASQDTLGEKYADIVKQAGDYVYSRGYYGPMGVDVMTDDQGKHYVIDLNVRHTGSYTLGLMKKHFLTNLNLPFGGLICPIPIMGHRDAFERKFHDEVESGKLVITGWCHGKAAGGLVTYSAAGMIVGAETRDELMQFMARLNACAIKQ